MKIILIVITLAVLVYFLYRKNLNKPTKKGIGLKEVPYLTPYETRIKYNENPIKSLIVEFRGQLPNNHTAKLTFQILLSTLDSRGVVNTVLSTIETFQAPSSREFIESFSLGEVEPYSGSIDWQAVGSISLDYLQPPLSGDCVLVVSINLIDENIQSKTIENTIIASNTHHYTTFFKDKGYYEEGSLEFKIRSVIVKLAIAVAYCDSEYHSKEQNVIKQWIKKIIKPYKREQKIELQKVLNLALLDAEKQGKENKLENIIVELKELNASKYYFEAIELVIDVMVADGKEKLLETKFINKIALLIGIDLDFLEDIKNLKISKLETPLVQVNH